MLKTPGEVEDFQKLGLPKKKPQNNKGKVSLFYC